MTRFWKAKIMAFGALLLLAVFANQFVFLKIEKITRYPAGSQNEQVNFISSNIWGKKEGLLHKKLTDTSISTNENRKTLIERHSNQYPSEKERTQRENNIRTKIRAIIGTPPPPSGDWIINETTTVRDSTIIVNGSIIINETGALVLDNSSIYMNLSADGEHWIDVYGTLALYQSLITAYDINNNYYIRVLVEHV